MLKLVIMSIQEEGGHHLPHMRENVVKEGIEDSGCHGTEVSRCTHNSMHKEDGGGLGNRMNGMLRKSITIHPIDKKEDGITILSSTY